MRTIILSIEEPVGSRVVRISRAGIIISDPYMEGSPSLYIGHKELDGILEAIARLRGDFAKASGLLESFASIFDEDE